MIYFFSIIMTITHCSRCFNLIIFIQFHALFTFSYTATYFLNFLTQFLNFLNFFYFSVSGVSTFCRKKKNAMIFQSDFHSTGKLGVQTVKNSHSFACRPQRPQRKLNYLGWPQSWPLCYSQSFSGTIYLITCLSYLTLYETLVLESTEIDDRQIAYYFRSS